MEIFKKVNLSLWKQVSKLVKDSVIFIDNHAAECLHWCGGVDVLFENGAVCVKEFSSFESGSPNQAKAVFILSSPLHGETEGIAEDIIKSSSFTKCLLISCLGSAVHSYACGTEDSKEDYLQDFSSKVSTWMGRSECSVEILHLPIFMSPVADNVFVTPAFDAIFPVQEKDLGNLELPDGIHHPSSLQDLHFYMFPKEFQTLVKMVSWSFRSFFHDLQCKEEIFALGSTSRLLSVQLSNISNQNKTSYPNKIGVLFIDRTLDLMSALSHSNKTLLDQLIGILPGLPCHYNNVSIDMSLLCNAQCEKLDDELIYSGCLVPDDKQHSLLTMAMNENPSASIGIVIDKIKTALIDEGVENMNINKSDELECIKGMIRAFQGNAGGILYNSALLQFGLAVIQLLEDPSLNVWKNLATEEKLILQQMGNESSDDLILGLAKIVKRGITFQDFCALLIYASHSIGRGIDSNSHDELCCVIHDLLTTANYSSLSESFISSHNLDENNWNRSPHLRKIAHKIVKVVSRSHINPLQNLKTLKISDIEPPSHQPLLPQVVNRIFDLGKPELEPDIEHITTGRKDLLKMGISMFRKITPPRPCDYPVLMIYVVGGITTSEVTQINKVLKKLPNQCQVVIGSNRLLSPSDVVDAVLFDDNLHPNIPC